jgi:hypothetical protein
LVSAAGTIPTHNILSLYLGFRNLFFRTSYSHILKYLADRLVRLAEGDSRSAYTSTLSQVHNNDIISVLDDRWEETIIFEDSGGTSPLQRGTQQPAHGVPTEVSYDTPIRASRQNDHTPSATAVEPTNHPIPTIITCPPVPEVILVTLKPYDGQRNV